jgi:YD repeat-containing protein
MIKKLVSIFIWLTLAINLSAQSASYIYDNLQRLTEIQYTNGTTIKYSYDANGNRLQHTITNSNQPIDLQMQNASLSSNTVGTGGNVNVSCVNFNAGIGTAPNHKVIYFLSTNNAWDNADIGLDSVITNSVAAGAGQNLPNKSIAIPTAISAGSYFLIIYTDARLSVTETNENNNIVALPINIINCSSLNFTISAVQPLCGQNNGSLTLNAVGGSAPYQYSINNGLSYQTGNSFTSLGSGAYNCKVKDANNCERVTTYSLDAQNSITPTANFTFITNGLNVQFTNSSSNATSFVWGYGDNIINASNSPTYTYAANGTYNVCLTATNSCGFNTLCKPVSVTVSSTSTSDSSAVWERKYYTVGNTNERYFAKGIMENDDSSVIIVGTKYIVANNTNCDNLGFLNSGNCVVSKAGYIHKLDKYGKPMWQTALSGSEFELNEFRTFGDNVNIVKLPTNNNFLFAANRSSNGVYWIQMNQGGNFVSSPFKYFHFFSPGKTYDNNANFYKVSDGIILMSRVNDGINNKMLISLTKLNYDGSQILWTKEYTISNGSFSSLFGLNLMQLNDGNLAIVGAASNNSFFNPGIVDGDALLLKVNNIDGSAVFCRLIEHEGVFQAFTSLKQAQNSSSYLNGYDLVVGGHHKTKGPFFAVMKSSDGGASGFRYFSNIQYGSLDLFTSKSDTLCAIINNRKGQGNTYRISLFDPSSFYLYNFPSGGLLAGKSHTTGLQNNNHQPVTPIQGLADRVLFSYSNSNTLYDSRHSVLKLDTSWQSTCSGSSYTALLSALPGATNNTLVTVTASNSAFAIGSPQFLTTASLNISDTLKCKSVQNSLTPICDLQASFDQDKETVCVGQSITFTNESAGNIANRKWLINGAQVGNSNLLTYSFTNSGNYLVQLIISNTICSDTISSSIVINPALTVVATKTNAICTSSNGTITLTSSGGTLPYGFSIDNGLTFGNSNTFSNLAVGTYNAVVKDAIGCTKSIIVTISSDNQSIGLVVDSLNINCNGENNGFIKLTPIGGTPNYSFVWSNGAISSSITNLAAGAYSVSVSDSKGCSIQRSFLLTQPSDINATATITPATCIPNGSLSLDVSGGVSPYIVNWSNGASSLSLNNLAAGNYTATVKDANNCTKQFSYLVAKDTILKSNGFPILNMPTTTNRIPEMCVGDSIILTVSAYNDISYQWYKDNLAITGATNNTYKTFAAGFYYCRLQDVNSCILNSNFVSVTLNPLPITTLTPQGPITLCGTQTTIINSFAGYAGYVWNNGSTGSSINVSNTGSFNVTITTDKGCKAISSNVLVTKHPLPNASITPTGTTVLCEGDSVVLIAPAGMAVYLWSNGAATQKITVKQSGTYNVKVTDLNGCVNTSTNKIVVVNIRPVKPVITQIGLDSLVANHNGFNYRWYKWKIVTTNNGIETYVPARSTLPTLFATTQGIKVAREKALYLLQYSNSFGCENVSDTFRYTTVVQPSIKISPNPATSMVNVFIQGVENSDTYQLQLLDINGKILQRRTMKPTYNEIRTEFNIGSYSQGVYIVAVKDMDNKSLTSEKIIKIK